MLACFYLLFFSSKIHILATLIWKKMWLFCSLILIYFVAIKYLIHSTHISGLFINILCLMELLDILLHCIGATCCNTIHQFYITGPKETYTVTQRVVPPAFLPYNPTWSSMKLIHGHCYFWQSQKQKNIKGTHWAKLLVLYLSDRWKI